jgi:hypothetical protein
MKARRLALVLLAAVLGTAYAGIQPAAVGAATTTNALQRFTPLYMGTGAKPTGLRPSPSPRTTTSSRSTEGC